MNIFLIDGIGPFFVRYQKRRMNWSKIPFDFFSRQPENFSALFAEVAANMDVFAARVREEGYNSISLDDVAHLAPDRWIEPEVNRLIEMYRREYRRLFAICTKHGLSIYLTMDILSLTAELKRNIGGSRQRATDFLQRQLTTIFSDFPQVKGVILRIGESDGKDVKGIFHSELLLKSSRQVNAMMRTLLPIAEQFDRQLILRTWTVGAYMIGDFIWHRRTTAQVLKGLDSPNFILSMKYGESDFFRYLPLNKHFRYQKCRKIVELQAKREYEGCGEYPSFIGWNYEKYASLLRDVEGLAGITVWVQTGGWVPFRRLSYLQPEGFWNELNSFVCIQLFRYGRSCEEAVAEFARQRNIPDTARFLEFLRLDEEVVETLLYIPELGEQKFFFRRIRLPPLLNVMWNNIFINDSVRQILLVLVKKHERCLAVGRKAMENFPRMEELAARLGLPVEDVVFMRDTFAILLLARSYYFSPYHPAIRKDIRKAKREYKEKYPKNGRPRYRIKTDFSPSRIKRSRLRLAVRVALRRKRGYRVVDYLFTLRLLGFLYHLVIRINPALVPKFARKQAMGIDTVFK